jgi:hypothetical protein
MGGKLLGSKDELKYVTPGASSGGVGTVIWHCVKRVATR